MTDKSHKTAISRKALSAPAGWLDRAGYLQGRVLDYGCGRGGDAERLGCEGYDPHYRTDWPVGTFRTIMCNFVLNVVRHEDARRAVLATVEDLLDDDGCAYITVRTDRAACKGETSIGTWQGLVTLGLPVVRRGSGYRIYLLRKGQSDCTMKAEVA